MNLSASFGTVCQVDGERAYVEPIPVADKPGRPAREMASTEVGMRFAVWAAKLREFPSVQQVRDQFGVHRSTAHQYRSQWAATLGVALPASPPPRRVS